MIGGKQYDRVRQLFLEALELPAAKREAWLLRQCDNDSALMEEVRSLLAHDGRAEDPLEKRLDEAIIDFAGEMGDRRVAPQSAKTESTRR